MQSLVEINKMILELEIDGGQKYATLINQFKFRKVDPIK